jgi:hypothetical protein
MEADGVPPKRGKPKSAKPPTSSVSAHIPNAANPSAGAAASATPLSLNSSSSSSSVSSWSAAAATAKMAATASPGKAVSPLPTAGRVENKEVPSSDGSGKETMDVEDSGPSLAVDVNESFWSRKQFNLFMSQAPVNVWYHSWSKSSRETDGRYVGLGADKLRQIVETQQKFRSAGNPFTFSELQSEVSKAVESSSTQFVSLVLMTTLLDDFSKSLMGEKCCLLLKAGSYFRGGKNKLLLYRPLGTPYFTTIFANGKEIELHSSQVGRMKIKSFSAVKLFF